MTLCETSRAERSSIVPDGAGATPKLPRASDVPALVAVRVCPFVSTCSEIQDMKFDIQTDRQLIKS